MAGAADTVKAGSGLFKGILQKLRGASPLVKGLGAAGTAQFALEFAPDIAKGARDTVDPWLPGMRRQDREVGDVLEAQRQARDLDLMRQRKAQELQRLVAGNTAMLAQKAPHLFNQIMAGRELPQDATVIGGRPRTDLMQEVAMQMARGQFSPQEVGGAF